MAPETIVSFIGHCPLLKEFAQIEPDRIDSTLSRPTVLWEDARNGPTEQPTITN